jgi:thiol-disulfide isomerase/thioredoxin
MKRIVPIFLVILISRLIYGISLKVGKRTAKPNISQIPAFSFWTLDSTAYTNTSLPTKQKLLLIHFNSTCEHCQYEAQELVKNAEKLAPHKVVMVSEEPIPALKAFYQKYALSKVPSLSVLKADNFSKAFGASGVPAIFIYDSAGKLLKNYQGEAKMEAILKYLE